MFMHTLITRVFITLTLLFTLTTMASNYSSSTKPHVLLTTSVGDIKLELDNEKAPISTQNFLNYVKKGYYNNLIFHRVIPDFMIQAGGFTADMQKKTAADPIKNEAQNGLRNLRGTIAMARLGERSPGVDDPINSATSEFFLNVNNNGFLDHGQRDFGYAVFGKVIAGMEVVDAIAKVQTHNVNHFQAVPIKPVIILSAKIIP